MAYTPYSQALPDTSRYTLDPVLQERLYQPVRTDPYQDGMLSTIANDYYADPFGYTNRRFGKLDEALATDSPEVGLGGMFAPPPMYGSDASADGPNPGSGYWAAMEAEIGREATLEAQAKSRQDIIPQLLELAIPGLTVAKGIYSLFNPPTNSYAKSWDEMTRSEKDYASGNQAPVSDASIAAAEANDAAGNAAAAAALAAQGITIDDFGGPSNSSGGGGSYSGPSTAAEAGYSGDFM